MKMRYVICYCLYYCYLLLLVGSLKLKLKRLAPSAHIMQTKAIYYAYNIDSTTVWNGCGSSFLIGS